MKVLHIFGDESGTMPKNDNDNTFIAATIAFFDSPPGDSPASGRLKDLCEFLNANAGIPFVAFVKPFTGYGDKVETKLKKMNIMARTTRLLTNANVRFLTDEGINLRNLIWIRSMQQAIGHIIALSIRDKTIRCIEVLLDEKTLPKPSRTLFVEQILKKPSQIKDVFAELRPLAPKLIGKYEKHICFTPKNINIKWSDEVDNSDSICGLKIADKLARQVRRLLMKRNDVNLATILEEHGYPNSTLDITQEIIRPLAPQTIRSWEELTGLREPREI